MEIQWEFDRDTMEIQWGFDGGEVVLRGQRAESGERRAE
jgi:hypothetical protein